MVTKVGSREIHDICVQRCCDTVGLPANSGRCRGDTGLLGIFFYPSLPMLHRSSGDGSTLGSIVGTSVGTLVGISIGEA